MSVAQRPEERVVDDPLRSRPVERQLDGVDGLSARPWLWRVGAGAALLAAVLGLVWLVARFRTDGVGQRRRRVELTVVLAEGADIARVRRDLEGAPCGRRAPARRAATVTHDEGPAPREGAGPSSCSGGHGRVMISFTR